MEQAEGAGEGQRPHCVVVPIAGIGGERRTYHGIAQPFAAHSHGCYVIGRVEQGSRTLELNGRQLPIGPGDLLAFNPGDVHGCCQDDGGSFAYDSVTLAPEVLDGAVLRAPQPGTLEAAEASAAFEGLVRALDAGQEEAAVERALLVASLLEAEPQVVPAGAAHDDAALRTYAHLCGHLAEPARIASLAAAEGLSEYALIRAYRKRFAITPLQHLMSMRIECACDLLAHGAAPADVAAQTGFADQAHLTRAFKQRVGTTPAVYRQMAGAAPACNRAGDGAAPAQRSGDRAPGATAPCDRQGSRPAAGAVPCAERSPWR